MFEGQLYQKSLHTRNRDTAIKLESMIRTELIKGEFGILNTAKTPNAGAVSRLDYWNTGKPTAHLVQRDSTSRI